ncbi:MAG TPA: hypothetical protein VJV79_22090, partial [Polyangiaceae bacterium]|nr:hypothetical protein [Polyangiaceae bacterium]
MKRSPVLYTACLAAFVSMNCSQAGPATSPGPSAGAPAAQAGSASAGAPALAGAGPTGMAGAPIASGGTGGSDSG